MEVVGQVQQVEQEVAVEEVEVQLEEQDLEIYLLYLIILLQ